MFTMAPSSAAVLFPAAVVALMAMALPFSAAAAPPPIGIGGATRLLLGDGTLRVTGINVSDMIPTVRVVREGSIINSTAGGGWNALFGRGFTEHGYWLSRDNELVVFGCNVVATLLDDGIEAAKTNNTAGRIGGCTSLCAKRFDGSSYSTRGTWTTSPETIAPTLHSRSDTAEEKQLPVNVFVAETGWIDELRNMSLRADEVREVPFLLNWSVTRGLPPPQLERHGGTLCTDEVHRMLCKSNNSICWNAIPGPGYTCHCEGGYHGNPYLTRTGGCKDINECTTFSSEHNRCFGECINTIGSMYCRCPYGTYGNPGVKDGCAKFDPTTADSAAQQLQRHLWRCARAVPLRLRTFDTSHGGTPRLLLDGNGTVQVIGISLSDSTVRVVHHTRIRPDDFIFKNYSLRSDGSTVVERAMSVEATLYGHKHRNSGSAYSNITGCVSRFISTPFREYNNCSGGDGCCHALIFPGSTPMMMEFRGLLNTSLDMDMPLAFVSEEGLTALWLDTILKINVSLGVLVPRFFSAPLVLQWAVKQGFPAPTGNTTGQCPGYVARQLCKSELSSCQQENGGYTCYCNKGYQGNPYIVDGCKGHYADSDLLVYTYAMVSIIFLFIDFPAP
nr:unnamed protein product [Digitaria exilis]